LPLVCSYIVYNVNYALSGNGEESFNPVTYSDADPDHH